MDAVTPQIMMRGTWNRCEPTVWNQQIMSHDKREELKEACHEDRPLT